MTAGFAIRQSQVLALLLLIMVLLSLVSFGVLPLVQKYIAYGDQIEQLERQLAVYERVAAGLPEKQQRLEALRANNPVADFYIQETRPALAAAELQQHLNRLVSQSGGQIASTQILQPKQNEPLQIVAIQVHLRSENEQLIKLLHSMEFGKPLLFVENLVVTASQRRVRQVRNRTSRRQQRALRQQLPGLDVRFDLVGYIAKGAS